MRPSIRGGAGATGLTSRILSGSWAASGEASTARTAAASQGRRTKRRRCGIRTISLDGANGDYTIRLDREGRTFFPGGLRTSRRLVRLKSRRNEVNAMKHHVIGRIGFAVAAICALGAGLALAAQIDLGLSVSDGRLSSFYLAVGEHYHVAPRL